MANIADLQAKVTELETTVNDEQAAISNALAAFEAEVARLQAIIDGSVTEEQLQAVADAITAIIEDVKATVPGLPEPGELKAPKKRK